MRGLLLAPVLPLLAHAFIVPDERVLGGVVTEHRPKFPVADFDIPIEDGPAHEPPYPKPYLEDVTSTSGGELDSTLNTAEEDEYGWPTWEERFDGQAWLNSGILDDDNIEKSGDAFSDGHPPHHHPPPHHGPPHHPPHHGPPHHGKPKSNKTVYELISESKYTTKLAKLINEFDDVVELLNGTTANFTVFAPTDAAFEKIPEHAPKPSKEFLKKILTYHVSPYFYPAGRVLASDTIPTAYNESALGDEPQRLAVKLGLKGLAINFYSRVVAVNIFGSNGVIHGIDSLLLPPPKAVRILNLLPSEFSTLLLAIEKTGLAAKLNDTSKHEGGTLFAPGNFAFRKLGPGPNAFLFSPPGLKYLKALLKYHIVANQTLYSDAFYDESGSDAEEDVDATRPRRYFHFDLPTLLEGRHLPVDITRYGPFISFKVNGFSRVVVKNGVAKDGVIHAVSDVLIPPKHVEGEVQYWQGEELALDDLKQRLAPFVDDEKDEVEERKGTQWNFKWEM